MAQIALAISVLITSSIKPIKKKTVAVTDLNAPAAAPAMTYVVKSATESVVDSNTLQTDDELQFTVEANSVYEVEANCLVLCEAASHGFQWMMKFPSFTDGVTIQNVPIYDPTLALGGQIGVRTSVTGGLGSASFNAGQFYSLRARFIVSVGSSGGVANLYWCQQSYAGTTKYTKVMKGSFLKYRKLV